LISRNRFPAALTAPIHEYADTTSLPLKTIAVAVEEKPASRFMARTRKGPPGGRLVSGNCAPAALASQTGRRDTQIAPAQLVHILDTPAQRPASPVRTAQPFSLTSH